MGFEGCPLLRLGEALWNNQLLCLSEVIEDRGTIAYNACVAL